MLYCNDQNSTIIFVFLELSDAAQWETLLRNQPNSASQLRLRKRLKMKTHTQTEQLLFWINRDPY